MTTTTTKKRARPNEDEQGQKKIKSGPLANVSNDKSKKMVSILKRAPLSFRMLFSLPSGTDIKRLVDLLHFYGFDEEEEGTSDCLLDDSPFCPLTSDNVSYIIRDKEGAQELKHAYALFRIIVRMIEDRDKENEQSMDKLDDLIYLVEMKNKAGLPENCSMVSKSNDAPDLLSPGGLIRFGPSELKALVSIKRSILEGLFTIDSRIINVNGDFDNEYD